VVVTRGRSGVKARCSSCPGRVGQATSLSSCMVREAQSRRDIPLRTVCFRASRLGPRASELGRLRLMKPLDWLPQGSCRTHRRCPPAVTGSNSACIGPHGGRLLRVLNENRRSVAECAGARMQRQGVPDTPPAGTSEPLPEPDNRLRRRRSSPTRTGPGDATSRRLSYRTIQSVQLSAGRGTYSVPRHPWILPVNAHALEAMGLALKVGALAATQGRAPQRRVNRRPSCVSTVGGFLPPI
jgi:hypothetical protein